MRVAIAELQAGRCIVIYPEGGRSDDGSIKPFQRGVALIVRRTRVPVVPMAIEGCFHAWPPSRGLPKPGGRISVAVGEPIDAATLLADDDDGMARLQGEVTRLWNGLREREVARD